MPPVPVETKHHPSSVDILLIKRLIAETSKPSLMQFLQHEFVNIGKSLAERLIGKKFCDYDLGVVGSCFILFFFHLSWSFFYTFYYY